jgi:beta-lactamase superfamily II metal-dependent hydrolase
MSPCDLHRCIAIVCLGNRRVTMSQAPHKVKLRTYQVGFGDCFLLTFCYEDRDRFVLIDFGSTAKPEIDGFNKKTLLIDIAKDIKQKCHGKLDAIIVTHRHRDHLGGFATKKNGKGSGNIIAGCNPDIVIQPWTEDPDIAESATEPDIQKKNIAFSRGLLNMQTVTANVLKQLNKRTSRGYEQETLRFVGELNLPNLSAVKNLIAMGKKGKSQYVHYGSESGLEDILPGVKSHILGPPTIEQYNEVLGHRSRDKDEYWMLQAAAGRHVEDLDNKNERVFSKYAATRNMEDVRADLLWFIRSAKKNYTDSTLELVRSVDKSINNTSIIMLFEVGPKKLLFSGDAQIENWEYVLKEAKDRDEKLKLIEGVDVYKVGHHGSRNATPKTLYDKFRKCKMTGHEKNLLKTVNSTLAGHHGNEEKHTEVPRVSLVKKLKLETDYFTTESLVDSLSKEMVIDITDQN